MEQVFLFYLTINVNDSIVTECCVLITEMTTGDEELMGACTGKQSSGEHSSVGAVRDSTSQRQQSLLNLKSLVSTAHLLQY